MRYILMMHVAGAGEYESAAWTPEEKQAHYDYWNRLNSELIASRELVGVEALTPPGDTRIVRAQVDKQGAPPLVTDGPFAESKEFLAGYWIVDVASAERAYAIAADASAAPGPGGAPLGMPIEVRPVLWSLPGSA